MSELAVLYTLPEAASRLRVSRRTVERLIDAGRIRPVRIGRRILVTERELAAFLASLR
jgi:excisionase family DNA binding protein